MTVQEKRRPGGGRRRRTGAVVALVLVALVALVIFLLLVTQPSSQTVTVRLAGPSCENAAPVRAFGQLWLLRGTMPDEWRPSVSGVLERTGDASAVLHAKGASGRFVAGGETVLPSCRSSRQ